MTTGAEMDRLARALHEALCAREPELSCLSWDNLWEENRADYRADVQALLTALLPPSEAVIEAMFDCVGGSSADKFTAAIQSILQPKDPGK